MIILHGNVVQLQLKYFYLYNRMPWYGYIRICDSCVVVPELNHQNSTHRNAHEKFRDTHHHDVGYKVGA